MARGATRACGFILASLMLMGELSISSLAQTPVRPTRVYGALSSGIECYRRGEYERAATFFQQAQAVENTLTSDGQKELKSYMGLNDTALQSRREGVEQLRKAEQAVKEGRIPEANGLLRNLATNPFLTPADKQRIQELSVPPVQETNYSNIVTEPAPGVPPIALARIKLEQARKLMNRADLDAAEALAHEALQLKDHDRPIPYNVSEDTPAEVLKDISKSRNDQKFWVSQARLAMQRNELDRAEKLARHAETVPASWSIRNMFGGDSPAKVLKDIQKQRQLQMLQQMQAVPQKVPPKPELASPKPVDPPKEKEPAGKLDSIKNLFNRGSPAPLEKIKKVPSEDEVPSKPSAPPFTPSSKAPANLPARLLAGAFATPTVTEVRVEDPPEIVQVSVESPAAEMPDETSRAGMPAAPENSTKKPAPQLQRGQTTGRKQSYGLLPAAFETPAIVQVGLIEPESQPAPADPARANARRLLKDAKRALDEGNLGKARQLAVEAGNLKVDFNWWEDSPEKILADIRRVEPKSPAPVAPAVTAQGDKPQPRDSPRQPARREAGSKLVRQPGTGFVKESKPVSKDDARALLKQARERFGAGSIEEAEKLAGQAKSAAPKGWGLFEDSPDKLLLETRKFRARRDTLQSARLLAEARTLYQTRHFEEAKAKAFQAEKLHGPYSVWDLGDRPQKLVAEIELARTREHKVQPAHRPVRPSAPPVESETPAVAQGPALVPAPNSGAGFSPRRNVAQGPAPAPVRKDTVIARQNRNQIAPSSAASGGEPPATGRGEGGQDPAPRPAVALEPPAPAWPEEAEAQATKTDERVVEARRLLDEARASIQQKDYVKALDLANRVEAMGIFATSVMDDSPGAVRRDVQIAQASVKQVLEKPQEPIGDPAREQARQLLAEARQLQQKGRLAEARRKALEAENLHVLFLEEEERPQFLLERLSGLAKKRVENLMNEAQDRAAGDPGQVQKAESDLNQARELAVAFAQDTQPIDARLAGLRQAREQSAAAQLRHVENVPPQLGQAQLGQAQEQPSAVPPGLISPDGSPELAPGFASVQQGQATPAFAAMLSPQEQELLAQGHVLLEKARVEISRGDTGMARKLAQTAYTSSPLLEEEALTVLRSVDAEEFNQRYRSVNRSFDAGLSAFQRKEYAQAAAIWRTIDTKLLEPINQARYREIMRTPEMQPRSLAQLGSFPASPLAPAVPEQPEPGKASASDSPDPVRSEGPPDTPAKRLADMLEVKFQKLRDDSLRARGEANKLFRNNDADAALATLQDFLERLRNTDLDENSLARLRRPIEFQMEQIKTLYAHSQLTKVDRDKKETQAQLKDRNLRAEQIKQETIADLMKQYHSFYKEGKYHEAEVAALKARELDPDNVAADAAAQIARIHGNVVTDKNLKDRKEEMVIKSLWDTDKQGPHLDIDKPLAFPDEDDPSKKRHRSAAKGFQYGIRSEKMREIERRLNQPINVNFKETTLRQAIDDLRDQYGLNIVIDERALAEREVKLDYPVSLKLEAVSLKSALNLLLQNSNLTYVIKDEVLQITTPEHARGKLEAKAYYVADLVMPIDNKTVGSIGGAAGLETVLNKLANQPGGMTTGGTTTPYTGQGSLQGGSMVGSPGDAFSPRAPAGNHPNGLQGNPNDSARGPRAPGQTLEDVLINLITNTIAPTTWSDKGGQGTIDFFPLGLALVVNQTPDIQEQIEELLRALRRLQDVEVTIEVRFITIAESFYERIGLDFNLNVLTDTDKFEPQITSGQFKPPGFVNDFEPNRFVAGLTPAGTFTHDLDIPIKSTSFGPAVPPFGTFPFAPGADGGISLGLAFLSDIQVFLFLEAAQGNRRTNVMQAPKLTMFNAQTATINILDTTFFVIGNVIGLFNGQVVYSPQNQPFAVGVQLTMQPIVSADRRFVRISLAPTLTNITNPIAALFPFTTIVAPTFDTGNVGQPIPIVQYLQQPSFTTVGVQTTVSVPDGGTVLLGGLKTLREGRNEFGPPILSKLPYINRLFKNVGYGRDAESLMLMVTPRIIINEEIEEDVLPPG